MTTIQDRAEQLATDAVMSPEGAEVVLRNIDDAFDLPEVRESLVQLAKCMSFNGYDDVSIALGINAMGRQIRSLGKRT